MHRLYSPQLYSIKKRKKEEEVYIVFPTSVKYLVISFYHPRYVKLTVHFLPWPIPLDHNFSTFSQFPLFTPISLNPQKITFFVFVKAINLYMDTKYTYSFCTLNIIVQFSRPWILLLSITRSITRHLSALLVPPSFSPSSHHNPSRPQHSSHTACSIECHLHI